MLYQTVSTLKNKLSFFRNGFAPVISIPTHERKNRKPSCIDNILTNDPGNCVLSSCITNKIGNHAPTFEFTDIEFEVGPKSEKHVQ